MSINTLERRLDRSKDSGPRIELSLPEQYHPNRLRDGRWRGIGKDVVMHEDYDSWLREVYKHLSNQPLQRNPR